MARIVKEPLVRRGEILETAQQLVLTRGYEQMTIQDILDALHISKGAFYHYFDSKQALLAEITERYLAEAEHILTPIQNDPDLNAVEKLNAYFATAVRWKNAQRTYLLALLGAWYSDDNAIVRQKLTTDGFARITPFIESILRQGVAEGLFSAAYPHELARVIITLIQSMGDTLAGMILSTPPGGADFAQVEAVIASFTSALERTLQAAPGALHLIDMDNVRDWFE